MLIKFKEIIRVTAWVLGNETLGHNCRDVYAHVNPQYLVSIRPAPALSRKVTVNTKNVSSDDFETWGNLYELTDVHGATYLIDSLDSENETLVKLLEIKA